MTRHLFVIFLALIAGCQRSVDDRPVATEHETTRDLHGDLVADNYQYLTDLNHQDTLTYLKAEREYLEKSTESWTALRNDFTRELNAVLPVATKTHPVQLGNFEYWREVKPGGQYPVYYRRESSSANSEIVLDMNSFAGGAAFYAIGDFAVSPDNAWVAFTEDNTGEQRYRLRILNIDTGEELPVTDGVNATLAWLSQEQLFYFDTLNHCLVALDPFQHIANPKDCKTHKALFYSLRLSREGDRVLLSGRHPDRTVVTVIESDGSSWLIPGGADTHAQMRIDGNNIYRMSNRLPNQFELSVASLDNLEMWQTISSGTEDVLDFEVFDAGIVLLARFGLGTSLYFVDQDTYERRLLVSSLEGESIRLSTNPLPSDTKVRIEIRGLANPTRVEEVDLLSGRREVVSRSHYDEPTNLSVAEYWFSARDGTRVPVSVLSADQNNSARPTLVTVYGAYGIPQDRQYRPDYAPLLKRGFAIAQIHVRGGGELGDGWHQAARLQTKQVAIDDLIDGVRFLIDAGYASDDQIYVKGVSAGAVLVAAAMNREPDLFDGVILFAPYLDLIGSLSNQSHWLTASDQKEWGNPAIKADYEYLKAYSPYEQLRAAIYPPVLISAAVDDNRVPASEALKWLAKLRAIDSGENIKLLNLIEEGGHFGVTDQYSRRQQASLEFAFLLTR